MAEDVISLAARRRQPKNPRRRWRATPRVLVFVLCLVCLRVAFGFGNRHLGIVRLQNKITRMQREIAALEQRNDATREQIQYMESDAFLEKMARDKLGLVKPGDVVYKPVRPAGPQDPPDVQKRPGKSGVAAGGGY